MFNFYLSPLYLYLPEPGQGDLWNFLHLASKQTSGHLLCNGRPAHNVFSAGGAAGHFRFLSTVFTHGVAVTALPNPEIKI